ncbi:CDGSH iron-sulfur domain-containing protein [Mobiluncus porci]|uniref:Iron-binding protein n=1 Tax=Mobiluncus porci TaxID=2652278 RepID=A0A7K0K1G6_9ACTO|nr:CDGSH iron-sulfur domain-containing protein [Mobiluncus porci]MST49336.1 iron-binding protein [Mobiluncus porci]
MSEQKVSIHAGGPAVVTGNVPLRRAQITPEGHGYKWDNAQDIPHEETYALCRCGKSQNKPFCDGSHVAAGFKGEENADRKPYLERSQYYSGEKVTLADDDRCAFARFCHGEGGDAWSQAMYAKTDDEAKSAAQVIDHCPSGRLSRTNPERTEILSNETEVGITLIEDPEKGCSGGIYVHGSIPLESSDGTLYELRDRYDLCRCGATRNQPFCNAMHVNLGFDDGHIDG